MTLGAYHCRIMFSLFHVTMQKQHTAISKWPEKHRITTNVKLNAYLHFLSEYN